jgi:hypothetical protein
MPILENAVEHGVAKRSAVMKLGAVEFAAGIAMRVNVDQSDGLRFTHGLEDSMSDRVVATDRERRYMRRAYSPKVAFDIVERICQIEAASKRHITDVGHAQFTQRSAA